MTVKRGYLFTVIAHSVKLSRTIQYYLERRCRSKQLPWIALLPPCAVLRRYIYHNAYSPANLAVVRLFLVWVDIWLAYPNCAFYHSFPPWNGRIPGRPDVGERVL